jgi:hypothetical protein
MERRKFVQLAVTSGCVVFFGCHRFVNQDLERWEEGESTLSDEERLVFSACLKSAGARNPVVINQTINPLEQNPRLADRDNYTLQELRETTFIDFTKKSGMIGKIDSRVDLADGYLVSNEDARRFFRQHGGGWDEFYEKYPDSNGMFRFSRVGFDDSKRQALALVWRSAGPLRGAIYLALLERDGPLVWAEKDRQLLIVP